MAMCSHTDAYNVHNSFDYKTYTSRDNKLEPLLYAMATKGLTTPIFDQQTNTINTVLMLDGND